LYDSKSNHIFSIDIKTHDKKQNITKRSEISVLSLFYIHRNLLYNNVINVNLYLTKKVHSNLKTQGLKPSISTIGVC